MGYKQSQKKGITSDLDEKIGRQFCRKSSVEIRVDFWKKITQGFTFNNKTNPQDQVMTFKTKSLKKEMKG